MNQYVSTQMSIQKSVGKYYYPGKEKTYWKIYKKTSSVIISLTQY